MLNRLEGIISDEIIDIKSYISEELEVLDEVGRRIVNVVDDMHGDLDEIKMELDDIETQLDDVIRALEEVL